METPAPERRSSRFVTWQVLAKIGAVSLAALSVTGGVVIENSNDDRAQKALAAAQEIPAQRNSCRIVSAEIVQSPGKRALQVIIGLTPGTRPDALRGQFDGVGSTVSITDGTGNLQSGVLLDPPDTADSTAPPQPQLSSSAGDGPRRPHQHRHIHVARDPFGHKRIL